MYLNESVFSLVLTLHSLELPETNIYPALIFGVVTYLFILLCNSWRVCDSNLTNIITICLNRNLHKPMYILLLNLPINDAMGATSLFPQLLYSIWSQDRSVSCSACLLQGFFVYLDGGASYLILTAMACDRFITICCPLRYGAIMTTNNLVKIITELWLFNFSAIIVVPFHGNSCCVKAVEHAQAALEEVACEHCNKLNIRTLRSHRALFEEGALARVPHGSGPAAAEAEWRLR
ncbi:putative olfactory receptor 2W6 [Megalobrama amblycephala]|uniref:putative olfactory receptor 2W6 n=1 Tax=Megalobrama amblycephala TaxID=75352 RepID=UPI0020147C19|nr:putative olfactory receptor 2W6 [Megalobrama amblycephala]